MNDDDLEEYKAHEAIWQKIYDAVCVVFSELQQGPVNIGVPLD